MLAILWHLLNPLLTIGDYYVVFGLLLDVSGEGQSFLLFLTIGLFVFQFTQRAAIQAHPLARTGRVSADGPTEDVLKAYGGR